ncbi:PaaX family transcriptional regulator C-terminal domain-containing protein [Nocardia asteroides]|uniref:PaaX family transcriptional regulator C-terminal domain-containing protein n=1 Tax=Nocardia asteroides TaxID=1824 RepID=UPI003433DFE8
MQARERRTDKETTYMISDGDHVGELTLRAPSARSVAVALLLANHPPQLSANQLVRSAKPFGIAESNLRVALSRMVAAGDLERYESIYRLSAHLIERQKLQNAQIHLRVTPWIGDWETAIVTVTGQSAVNRAGLRTELNGLRLAELREGVWLRPANLDRKWPPQVTAVTQRLLARPVDSAALARSLWPLQSWADHGWRLIPTLNGARKPALRFAAATATFRHLLTDPQLPESLLPRDWPAAALRHALTRCFDELVRSGDGPWS